MNNYILGGRREGELFLSSENVPRMCAQNVTGLHGTQVLLVCLWLPAGDKYVGCEFTGVKMTELNLKSDNNIHGSNGFSRSRRGVNTFYNGSLVFLCSRFNYSFPDLNPF